MNRFVTRLLAVGAGLALSLALVAPAEAGGWAVASLDAPPAAVAGSTEPVGFTILQHGQTPIDLTEGVAIDIVLGDGTTASFPARLEGPTGHYVADVEFPAAGTYTWQIRPGVFAPQDLGTLTVSPSEAAGGTTAWSWLRWLMLGLSAVLAGVGLVDLLRHRQRGLVLAGR